MISALPRVTATTAEAEVRCRRESAAACAGIVSAHLDQTHLASHLSVKSWLAASPQHGRSGFILHMNIKETVLNAAAVLSATCAVVVTVGLFFHPSWITRGGAGDPSSRPAKTPVANWEMLLQSGHRIGPEHAALTIIEFADFECPFCGKYALVIDSVRARYPNDFAVVFHHFPLPYHNLAYPLARAAECVSQQGVFAAFYDSVYRKQNLFGILSLEQVAMSVGVPDSSRLRRCLADTARVAAIDSDLALGRRIGVGGTPEVVVDGNLYAPAPNAKELEAMVASHLHR